MIYKPHFVSNTYLQATALQAVDASAESDSVTAVVDSLRHQEVLGSLDSLSASIQNLQASSYSDSTSILIILIGVGVLFLLGLGLLVIALRNQKSIKDNREAISILNSEGLKQLHDAIAQFFDQRINLVRKEVNDVQEHVGAVRKGVNATRSDVRATAEKLIAILRDNAKAVADVVPPAVEQIADGEQTPGIEQSLSAGPVSMPEFVSVPEQEEELTQVTVPEIDWEGLKMIRNEQAKTEEVLSKAKKQFEKWREYILNLPDVLDNNLRYEFLEILESEDFYIVKDQTILTFPVEVKSDQKAMSGLVELADGIQSAERAVPTWKKKLPKVHVRQSGELDFRIDDANIPEDVLDVLRDELSTTLLLLKGINKSRHKLTELVSELAKKEQIFQSKTGSPFTSELLTGLQGIFAGDEESVRVFEESMNRIQENRNEILGRFETIQREAIGAVESLEKKLFTFLERHVIRLANDIRQTKKNYMVRVDGSGESESFLKEWGGLYSKLYDLVEHQVLKKDLNIEPIPTTRGEMYNGDIHEPYTESEPDAELEDNMIKQVVNKGYRFDDGEWAKLIKCADVIVVRN